MATNITVSLFLPTTVAFEEPAQAKSRRRAPPFALHRRATSTLDLPTVARLSSLPELFEDKASTIPEQRTPPTSPDQRKSRLDSFFDINPEQVDSYDPQTVHFATPGDPRSLVRSEPNTDWGSAELVFYQPRSTAAPLPSPAIQDFGKAYEELRAKKQQPHQQHSSKQHVTPSHIPSLGAQNNDYDFEGKSWTVKPAVHGNGGLTNAMRAVSAPIGTLDVTWIGSIGFSTDALSQTVKESIRDKLLNDHQSVVVYCSDKDINGHYLHFCKTILWPIFHYQVPDHPKSKAYADHSWKFYEEVNRAFADQVIASYKKGDTIWVHDYHLLLVPGMLREKLPEAKVGFFLHTAFPSSEIFRCLSTRTELLMGMLGANLIGFQAEEYATHFLQTCSRLLTIEATAEGVQLEDRFVNVISQPIGIDPEMFIEARKDSKVQAWVEKLLEQYGDKRIIIARDQLDNVHGVRQKLLAYELFLRNEPAWRDKVLMIQVATSATEQSELMSQVADIISRIEAAHSSLGSQQPLIFLKQDIAFHQYLALLAAADVMIVSPLRDGMNLTPHEYIFCQDGEGAGKKHGPLILSEFTGSAAVLGNGHLSVNSDHIDLARLSLNPAHIDPAHIDPAHLSAKPAHLSVNPWDYQGQVRAIKKALEMSAEEKEDRWSRLHNVVLRETGSSWAQKLAKALDEVHAQQVQRASSAVPRLSTNEICGKYRSSQNRLFLIDYEGTLAPHKTPAGVPLGSPVRVIDTLNELMADPRNIIYVMSGRTPEDLVSHFHTIPRVGLIAEDGSFVREFDPHSPASPYDNTLEPASSQAREGAQERDSYLRDNEWIQFPKSAEVAKWKNEVHGILQYYQERVEHSYIEHRHTSLVFHYEKAEDQETATRQAGECADQISNGCTSIKLRAIPIAKAIHIEQEEFSKATAAQQIFAKLARRPHSLSPDFLMVVGGNRSDEVVFRWANTMAAEGTIKSVFTITAGKRNTEALTSLTQGATGLLNVLQKMAKISADELPDRYTFIPRNRSFPGRTKGDLAYR